MLTVFLNFEVILWNVLAPFQSLPIIYCLITCSRQKKKIVNDINVYLSREREKGP